jgi:hypothetical protein
MFYFWKNPLQKCTRSFPRCNVNRGKVTSWRILVSPPAAPSIITQVPHSFLREVSARVWERISMTDNYRNLQTEAKWKPRRMGRIPCQMPVAPLVVQTTFFHCTNGHKDEVHLIFTLTSVKPCTHHLLHLLDNTLEKLHIERSAILIFSNPPPRNGIDKFYLTWPTTQDTSDSSQSIDPALFI